MKYCIHCGDIEERHKNRRHKFETRPDNCQICKGTKGGLLGNENRVDGIIMCDYCHSEYLNLKKS